MNKEGKKLGVLLVTAGFYPASKYGGPVTSLVNLVDAMSHDIDVYVLTLNHDFKSNDPLVGNPGKWIEFRHARVMYLSEREFNARKVWTIVSAVNPDFVYLNNFYNVAVSMPTIIACRRHKYPLLLAFRGELMPGAISQKRLKKLLFIRMSKFLFWREWKFQATSIQEVLAIQHRIGCTNNRIVVLENFPVRYKGYTKRKKKAPGFLSLIYLARIHPGKNLLMALQALSKVEGKILFRIYGPIEDETYWGDCVELIGQMPESIEVDYKGACRKDRVESVYEESHAMILPTLTENYGHSIVESMLAGCPVVISDQTPWNRINDYRSGWAVPLSNEMQFTAVLQTLVDMDQADYDALLENNQRFVEDHFTADDLKTRYMRAFISMARRMYE